WQGATNFNNYFANEAVEPGIPALTPLTILTDYWTPTNPKAKYPNLIYNVNNYYQSTYWLQDGTYLRLKNIQLGYTIPERLIKKLAISSLRLYVSAFNIFTIDKAYPYDPETGGDSYSNRGWYYPQQKTMSAGLNISF
ncbi:MAG TPA: TonB-dependent receptor, partial [Bacteroidales bacterium]|nr:TonB-dependent receptor [Bacteroidales bacterium]